MKKMIVATLAIGMAVTGCKTMENPFKKEKAIGMANPASEFCVKQGGKLIPKKDKRGNEYALCQLPDGKLVEEWEYFKQYNK